MSDTVPKKRKFNLKDAMDDVNAYIDTPKETTSPVQPNTAEETKPKQEVSTVSYKEPDKQFRRNITLSEELFRRLASDLRWPEESGYAQLHPVLDGDYVYIFAVPGGRARSCKLMRVLKDEIENFAAYEYLVGRDETGKGIFKKGKDAMYSDFYAVGERVGGMGVMWNEYLEEWVMMYCTWRAGRIDKGAIAMRVAKTLDGEWSDAVLVASQKKFGIVYEPRICSRYVKEGGKHMMLISSKWEIYNSLVWDIELSRKDDIRE